MSLLPLFPLPNAVLFPGMLLPLHIFEPRYRSMVADALEADRRIGMVLLRPGWETDYDGRPRVHDIGCSGVIVHAARLDDGRYNLVLRGLDRFRVVSEDRGHVYRRATVEPLPDSPLDEAGTQALHDLRRRLDERLGLPIDHAGEGDATEAAQLAAMPDAEFVHTLAQHLDLEPIERQAVLERETLHDRATALLELLDMKGSMASMPAGPDVAH